MSDQVTTLLVRGEGGAEFHMDVPPAGSNRREIFDEHVRKGWLVVLEGEIPDVPATPEPDPLGDPTRDLEDLTVAELKEVAAERGVDLGDATKKADIIDVIESAATDGDEDDDLP